MHKQTKKKWLFIMMYILPAAFIGPLMHLHVPEALGGGFLMGTPENMDKGLHTVAAATITQEKKREDNATSKPVVHKHAVSGTSSKLSLSMGYRIDDVDWNIAGDISGENPNVLSELTWSDLEIYQVKFGNKTMIPRIFYFRGSLAYGWIFDGKNQDADFFGDDRTLEFSRSNNSGDNGNVFDASLGIGYPFTFGGGKFRLSPLLGYSYHEQHLTITDGYQTIPPLGPFPDLDSTYEAEWDGPWLGLDLTFQFNKKHSIFTEFEYHWADYYAVADWNLRGDYAHPKSFEHETDGTGIVVSMGWTYLFHDRWGLDLTINYQNWSTDPGIDRVFTSGGATAETRLNEVNWESSMVMIGLSYSY
jgi:hypothetical protein